MVTLLSECDEERLFNATWPQSYTGTQLTLPCVISEGICDRVSAL